MTLFLVIFGFVLLLPIIFKEAAMVRQIAGLSNTSKLWHRIGVVLRCMAFVPIVVALYPNWVTIVLLIAPFAVVGYVLYDGIIGLFLGQSFWYIGETSELDKFYNQKIATIIKIIVMGITLGSLISLCLKTF